jgi:hypothetical protein
VKKLLLFTLLAVGCSEPTAPLPTTLTAVTPAAVVFAGVFPLARIDGRSL